MDLNKFNFVDKEMLINLLNKFFEEPIHGKYREIKTVPIMETSPYVFVHPNLKENEFDQVVDYLYKNVSKEREMKKASIEELIENIKSLEPMMTEHLVRKNI